MTEVEIRALQQNAPRAVAAAAAGETITVTDRARAVAQLTPLPSGPLAVLMNAGQARAPRRALSALPEPLPGLALSAQLAAMRADPR